MKKTWIFFVAGALCANEVLEDITVSTHSSKGGSTQEISKQVLKNLPAQSLSDILRINPNIKVGDKFTTGDLDSIEPEKFEINNAKYYQNSIVIDGMKNDSIIDPISKNSLYDTQGSENKGFVDLDLIESLEVFDSMISAKYGQFSGGVINAKIKRARKKTSAKIGYSYTNESLTKIHDYYLTKYHPPSPKFKKQNFNAYVSGMINNKNSALLSYAYKDGMTNKPYLQTRQNVSNKAQNFFLKHSYFFDNNSILDTSIRYDPYTKEALLGQYVKDGKYTNLGGGSSIAFSHKSDHQSFVWSKNVSLSFNQDTRDTQTDYLKRWKKTNTKYWGADKIMGALTSPEGSWGDIEKTQTSFKTTFDFDFEDASLGVDVDLTNGTYERKNDFFLYTQPKYISHLSCNGNDEDCVDGEQFFTRRDIYQKEKVRASIFSISPYAQKKFSFKGLKATLGVRLDYNDYLENFDFCPRSSFSFDIAKTQIFWGLNRYYGKSFLSFKLREGRRPFRSQYRSTYKGQINNPKSAVSFWTTSADKGSLKYVFNSLRTPYTDEFTIGLNQYFFGMALILKYIDRKAKDQFKQEKLKKVAYTRPDGEVAYFIPTMVNNDGKTDSQIFTLRLETTQDIFIANTNIIFGAGYNTSTSHTNFMDYDSNDENFFYVYYKGKYLKNADIANYKRPDRANVYMILTNNFELFSTKLNFVSSFFLQHTSSFTRPSPIGHSTSFIKDGVYEDAQIYEDESVGKRTMVDAKFSAGFKIDDYKVRLNADVYNIFDKLSNEGRIVNGYEMGRQIYLGMEVLF